MKFSSKKNLPYNQVQGLSGEKWACEYLQKKGFQIVEQRFHTRFGELDIIAVRDQLLVFVEVKYRVDGKAYGNPFEAITPKKIKKLNKAALYFLLIHPEYQKHHMEFRAISIESRQGQRFIESVSFLLNES